MLNPDITGASLPRCRPSFSSWRCVGPVESGERPAGAISFGMIGNGHCDRHDALLNAAPSFGFLRHHRARQWRSAAGPGPCRCRRIAMDGDARSWSPPFHSLVGLAAVLGGRRGALCAPRPLASASLVTSMARAWWEDVDRRRRSARSTFTGSVIAFLKLDGRMSGKTLSFLPQRHVINAGPCRRLLLLLDPSFFVRHRPIRVVFWLIVIASLSLGGLINRPDRRGAEHAGRGLDAQLPIPAGAAAGIGFHPSATPALIITRGRWSAPSGRGSSPTSCAKG